VHACDERRGVAQRPILEGPRQRSRLTRTVAVMAQVGEPNVKALGAEEVRQPPGGPVQEGAVVRESAVHEEDRGPPVAVGAQPMQRQVDPVDRGDVARAHS